MQTVTHEGEVVEDRDQVVKIRMLAVSACHQCTLKKGCSMAESAEKILTIPHVTGSYVPGEKVVVAISRQAGFLAVTLAFLVPFAILVILITALALAGASEMVTGLTGIGGVGLYYLLLYFFRQQLERRITFTINRHVE